MAKKKNFYKNLNLYAIAKARIVIGLIFLWAFVDKLVGLGFTTCRNAETNAIGVLCEKAWLSGGSPTEGFLTRATRGPFAEVFQSMAGNPVVDWLFMLGLLGIGLGLTLGIALKLSGYSGALLVLLMWLAALPPANNPVLDDHIVYALVLIYVANTPDQKLSLNRWYSKTPLGRVFK